MSRTLLKTNAQSPGHSRHVFYNVQLISPEGNIGIQSLHPVLLWNAGEFEVRENLSDGRRSPVATAVGGAQDALSAVPADKLEET